MMQNIQVKNNILLIILVFVLSCKTYTSVLLEMQPYESINIEIHNPLHSSKMINIIKNQDDYKVNYITYYDTIMLLDTTFNIERDQLLKYQNLLNSINERKINNNEYGTYKFHDNTLFRIQKVSRGKIRILDSYSITGEYNINEYLEKNQLPTFNSSPR